MNGTETLTFNRTIAAPADRIYQALLSAEDRRIWGVPDADSVLVIEGQPDPAPGGRETSRVGPRDNPYVDATTDWIILQPSERVVYSELLSAEGTALGISLASFDLAPDSDGTNLSVIVQIISYVGDEAMDEIRAGWTHAVEALSLYASAEATQA